MRAAAAGGAIVNVASIAALGGNGGAAYTVSEHGLLGHESDPQAYPPRMKRLGIMHR
jgi:hypothetical protein